MLCKSSLQIQPVCWLLPFIKSQKIKTFWLFLMLVIEHYALSTILYEVISLCVCNQNFCSSPKCRYCHFILHSAQGRDQQLASIYVRVRGGGGRLRKEPLHLTYGVAFFLSPVYMSADTEMSNWTASGLKVWKKIIIFMLQNCDKLCQMLAWPFKSNSCKFLFSSYRSKCFLNL